MVTSRSNIEQNFFIVISEDGRDDRDIRQMRAAVIGIVQHVHVTALHPARILAHHGPDAVTHRPQVHGHVWRIGDQVSVGIEQRTTEVEALLDIYGVGRVRQP